MNDRIPELIARAIEAEVTRVIEVEIENVKKRVEKEVRGAVGSIAGRVLTRFSFEQYGEQLKIVVDFKNTERHE